MGVGRGDPSWREAVMHSTIGWTLALGSVLAGFILISSFTWDRRLQAAPMFWPMLLSFAALSPLRHRGLAYRFRAWAYVVLLIATASFALLSVGFGAGSVVVLVFTVVAAGVFIGSTALLMTLAATTVALGLCLHLAAAFGLLGGVDASGAWLLRSLIGYSASAGCLAALVLYLLDAMERAVTARQRTEAALRERDRLAEMGELLSAVAHEVRNPLTAISGSIDLLEKRHAGDPKLQRGLERVRGQTRRLQYLMNQLLEMGRPVGAREPCALQRVLKEAVDSCAALGKERRVRVEIRVDEDVPPVAADPDRLVQVFLNLTDNAIRHSEAGGLVNVSASAGLREGRLGAECSVEDSGPGFDEDDVARLFEPFFTRRKGGVGLGLALVQRIVSEHSGAVEAGNRPDVGAYVRVWLPGAVEG